MGKPLFSSSASRMPAQDLLDQRAVALEVGVDLGDPAVAKLVVLGRGLAVLLDVPLLELPADRDQLVGRDLQAQLASHQAQADGLVGRGAVREQGLASRGTWLLHHGHVKIEVLEDQAGALVLLYLRSYMCIYIYVYI